ncbi:MAG: thioredoxin family protein [Candidatus Pedobacter colombiensis]|uniref:Thioredoxin family protein n=1 Tax=Candidatus Pedobacter colombiensis TaxID=3121371 RepID=A0AAJ5W600_9SPHI|nr:thioredoxin family protein [Pedobacter sp.]WEK18639.1 MAG: thioredoxin family protein [Pedobacter sp.]
MKRRLITLTLSIGVMLSATAQNRSINFKHEGSFNEHLATAAKEKKLLFFDAFTSWCGPCKTLAKDVFTVDSVADYFNANFINVGYDMEKGEGIELKKRFASEINAYPTLLFINGKGEVVHKIVGAPSVKEFMELSKLALNPEHSLKGLEKKFNNGDHSLNTITAYLKALGNAYDAEKTKAVATAYFDAMPVAELNKPEIFELIKSYLYNIDAKTFKYILSNRAALGKVHGAEKVDGFLIGNLSREVNGLSSAYYGKKPVDTGKEAWLVKNLENFKNEQAGQLLVRMSLISSRNKGDWAAFNQAMIKMITDVGPIKGASSKTSTMLNFTRKFTEAAPAEHLADALNWADLLLKTDVNVPSVIDLLTFKKVIYNKMGNAELVKETDNMITTQNKIKADLEKNGTSFPGAMRGFM